MGESEKEWLAFPASYRARRSSGLMNRNMVLAEWQRATQSLHAAELLAREGYREDAVSRAYYAILHAAKAALFVHDVATTSHAAVRRIFGRHLPFLLAISAAPCYEQLQEWCSIQ